MSDDVREPELPTFFSLLPEAIDDADLDAWSVAGAASMAVGTDWAEDDAQLERTAFMLRHLVRTPQLPGFDLRFLFMIHPSVGASLWHVALLMPDGDEADTLPRLAGADAPASLQSTVEWHDSDGLRVCQCIAMDDLDPVGTLPTGDRMTDRVLQATVGIAVRRELPGLGLTDVLAYSSSTNLESLFVSVEPARFLISGDAIRDEVAAAADA